MIKIKVDFPFENKILIFIFTLSCETKKFHIVAYTIKRKGPKIGPSILDRVELVIQVIVVPIFQNYISIFMIYLID